jgi:hypothetical protein
MDKEGDVLVLDPNRPEKHMPNIQLGKMTGRGK